MNERFEQTHEELAATSAQESSAVTAEWESNPDRWKQSPEEWPAQLVERLDSATYVDHPLSDLRDVWGPEFLREQGAFSEEFLTLMTYLHRTLVKDASPRALVMVMRQDVDPDLPNWAMPVHAEPGLTEVAFAPLPEMAARLPEMPVDEVRQIQAVWVKVADMVREVADYLLAMRGFLTDSEAQWVARTSASPERFADRIAEKTTP